MQMISNESLMVLGVLIAGILLLLYIMRRRVRLGKRVGKF
jgi:LPXTG-motif cell wall-anchored protein